MQQLEIETCAICLQTHDRSFVGWTGEVVNNKVDVARVADVSDPSASVASVTRVSARVVPVDEAKFSIKLY